MIENQLKGNTDFQEEELEISYDFNRIILLEYKVKVSLGWTGKKLEQSLIKTLIKESAYEQRFKKIF